MADIQPVAAGRDQHEGIAQFMVGVISVVQLPAHPVVTRKGALAKNELDMAKNLFVNEHPEVVEVADGDDMEAKADLASDQVIAEQGVARRHRHRAEQKEASPQDDGNRVHARGCLRDKPADGDDS